jgi:bacterioferritin-associated ferredoxin
MTEIEAADHMRQIRLRRLASSLMRDANLAITEKEINRLISRAEFAKLDDVRGALRNRKKEIVALGSEFSRLGVFHRLYNSGLSSLARRQIDLAIKHGVTTFAGLRDFAGVHAADRTYRGTACQELIDRMK